MIDPDRIKIQSNNCNLIYLKIVPRQNHVQNINYSEEVYKDNKNTECQKELKNIVNLHRFSN